MLVNYRSLKTKASETPAGESLKTFLLNFPVSYWALTSSCPPGGLLTPPSENSLLCLRRPCPSGHWWGVCSRPPTSAGLWFLRPFPPRSRCGWGSAAGPEEGVTTTTFTHDITLSPGSRRLWVQGSQGLLLFSFPSVPRPQTVSACIPQGDGKLGPSIPEPSDRVCGVSG